QTRIALSSSDEVYASYYAGGNLYLAVPDGAGFSTELLDSRNDVGVNLDLALDNNDQPHVAYYDDTYGDLKYVTWGPHWELRSVHPGTNSQEPDLALNQTSPGVSFHNLDDLPDELLYAAWDGTDWAAQTLQTSSNSTAHTSLRYDSQGRPHVAAITALDRSLTYRFWDGTAWQTELVEEISTGDFGHEIQLLLDDADFPIIIYTHNDGGQRRLRLAWWDGNAWQFSTNNQSPTLGGTYELAAGRLAGSSLVYVSYYDMSGGDLRLAAWDGAGWSDELVEAGGGADTGRFPAIAIDASLIDRVFTEIVAIAYFDVTNQRIRYSYRDTSWHHHTAVTGTGPISSLDLTLGNDTWHSPYIAYTAGNDNSLRLAYSVDGLQTFPIDIIVAGSGAAPTQVSLDYDFAPRLAFRDGNGQIQYAFPGSRHLAAAPPPDANTSPSVFPLAPVVCIQFVGQMVVPKPVPAASPAIGQPRDESTLGALTFLFARTAAGHTYLELYADHVGEMAQITWSDPTLAWDAYLTLENLMPGLEALVNDSGDEVMVTQAMVDQALDIWQRIAAQAGPELAGVINGQLAATNNLQDFVGGSFDDWALGIGVMPPGGNVYLPLITVPGTTTPPADSQSAAPPPPVAALPAATDWRRHVSVSL
ncbi:MAG: hypothetical protein KDE04_11670, partial [Anaerolineales bacterium]|nr:hypothetical protein [Anaerolineales bacterium]